ncbi:hypothetical protein M8J76_013276 [Diaphorina citri]|nr:hypothetical protein M8J76_013276 [Diaphorina citri]
MSSLNKCKNCGSSDLDVDPARGDTVCTNCGTVLEDSVIVSEMQFEENAHGGTSALGHFVSSDSKGGCQGFGGALRGGLNRESREITLDNCKRNISSLCNQLRLNQHCLETSFNLYKMALSRNLTKGRRQILVCAACVYMTCRLEGTSHLLIDFSELLQICIFELGRTYLRLSQALCISIPSMDPCLYVLRYSNRLDFGAKTHEVTMTALRILQRMKKDMLHSGRRPNGLIGAALLMAARWHEFNRSVINIVKIVNTTESTLKKRLLEFGDTPSSLLTLEEFMNVDLEEEQDPPAYKTIRKKDSERVQKLLEDEDENLHFAKLRRLIEKKLEETSKKRAKRKHEVEEPENGKRKAPFKYEVPDSVNINPNTSGVDDEVAGDNYIKSNELPRVIKECLEDADLEEDMGGEIRGIGPTPAMLGMATNQDAERNDQIVDDAEDDLGDIDDEEINSYILTEGEATNKAKLWEVLNREYLTLQAERKAREEVEGKKEKKKRKPKANKATSVAKTAGEAIEKMLKEKKISTKINYDVLKSLDFTVDVNTGEMSTGQKSAPRIIENLEITSSIKKTRAKPTKEKREPTPKTPPKVKVEKPITKKEIKEEVIKQEVDNARIDEYEDDYDFEEEKEEEEETLSSMFRRNVDEEEYDDY